jgi:hypothetical protein
MVLVCICYLRRESRYDMLRVQMDNLLKSHKDLRDRLASICSGYGDILSLVTPPASIGAEPSPGPDLRYIQLVAHIRFVSVHAKHRNMAASIFYLRSSLIDWSGTSASSMATHLKTHPLYPIRLHSAPPLCPPLKFLVRCRC